MQYSALYRRNLFLLCVLGLSLVLACSGRNDPGTPSAPIVPPVQKLPPSDTPDGSVNVPAPVDGGPAGDGGPARSAPSPSRPPLASAPQIRDALVAAQNDLNALSVLVDFRRGLDVDFTWAMGYLTHTACDRDEMAAIETYLRDDGLWFYQVDPVGPFSCSQDLSRCVNCAADLSGCPDSYMFELEVNPEGERFLMGVVARPTSSQMYQPTSVEQLARQDAGSYVETGVRCEIRSTLLGGQFSDLWEYHDPNPQTPPVTRHHCGEAATAFARSTAGVFGILAYCGVSRCIAHDNLDILGIPYVRGQNGQLQIRYVTRGEPQAPESPIEPPARFLQRVRTERCP